MKKQKKRLLTRLGHYHEKDIIIANLVRTIKYNTESTIDDTLNKYMESVCNIVYSDFERLRDEFILWEIHKEPDNGNYIKVPSI